MSILDKVKAIFRFDDDLGKKVPVPIDQVGHGNDLQKLADETSSMIEIHLENGTTRYIHPKDVFIDAVTKRHSEVVW